MDNKFNESNAATCSDHGDDLIDDDDDLDYDGVDDDAGCEGDDCSVVLDVQEIDSSDDDYGPYTGGIPRHHARPILITYQTSCSTI